MSTRQIDRPGTALLRRLREPAPPQPEACAFCGQRLPGGHRHLVDVEERSLACACTACGLLFHQDGAAGGRYRPVPDRYLVDPEHSVTDAVWDSLRIPVSTVFFLRNAAQERPIALYPSPAGATESELDEDDWQAVLGGSPLAALLEPDVEALLLRRSEGHNRAYLVPVDACYELVGRMRLHWQGFDGGAEARAELDAYFDRLDARARPVGTGGAP
ncbi:hypothetical protein KNE206_36900 [Kitasatospora sp. NE20-6]|uniref:DUF5947 family protein n=1 Tax=Kitasatospora sp. NE20-6 TaxID=2859066 RepID=UPI0034DC27EC